MRRSLSQPSAYLKSTVSLLALLLVLSFGLHTFQVDHTHPGTHSADVHHQADGEEFSGVSKYLHGSEKKLFLILVLGLLALGALLRGNIPLLIMRRVVYVALSLRSESSSPRIFDHTVSLFRRGILNPKTY